MHANQSSSRGSRWRRATVGAWALPVVLTVIWCCLLRPELRSIAAPVFGPWAGYLYGHQDCTMATALPLFSWITVAVGVVALVALVKLRRSALRFLGLALAFLWTLAWGALAMLSVLNTTS